MTVVWIDMLEGDDAESASRASRGLPALPFAVHYHDPERAVGRQVAEGLGAPGRTAWDFYLIYAREQQWTSLPPAPIGWFHQLRDDAWAGPRQFRWGNDLGPALRALLDRAVRLSHA